MSNDLVRLDIADVVIDGPSLEIGDLSLEEFDDLGRKLRSIEGHSQFWIGDWANALKDQHGKGAMLKLAREIGYEIGTVRNYASISRRYETSLRNDVLSQHPKLSFDHFRLAITAPSPKFALGQAGSKSLSTRELAKWVKEENYRRKTATTNVEEDETEVSFVGPNYAELCQDDITSLLSDIRAYAKSDVSDGDKEQAVLGMWTRLTHVIAIMSEMADLDEVFDA